MEEQFFKLLGRESSKVTLIDSCIENKCIYASAERDGLTVYLVFKMIAITKPQYNDDGAVVPDKHWKYFMPIIVKATTDSRFSAQLYNMIAYNTAI